MNAIDRKVARGIVRRGSFASSLKTTVASNPVKQAAHHSSAIPNPEPKTEEGSKPLTELPDAPPSAMTATSRTSSTTTSHSSSTPSVRRLTSTPQYARPVTRARVMNSHAAPGRWMPSSASIVGSAITLKIP